LLLLLGFLAGAVFLLWEEFGVATTRDAILWLPQLPTSSETRLPVDGRVASTGDSEAASTPLDPQVSPEDELAVARAELAEYVSSLEAARQAIEDAVIMVREQKENFDFAEDRYTTLMPLVETGALEPLAASQIQSAYISARASLAQAKFFLSQARRDFGTEPGRRLRLQQLQNRVAVLESTAAAQTAPDAAPNEDPPPSDGMESERDSSFAEHPRVEAYFRLSPASRRLVPGQIATISSPAWGRTKQPATITEVSLESSEGSHQILRVLLILNSDLPPIQPPRAAVPVRVRVVF
jgi:hypothetical protein